MSKWLTPVPPLEDDGETPPLGKRLVSFVFIALGSLVVVALTAYALRAMLLI